jgi:glutamate decarboxylase
MVHLNRVATEAEVKESKKSLIDGFKSLHVEDDDDQDDFTATVYGSKYAAEDLPKHEMPVSLTLTLICQRGKELTGWIEL